MKRLVSSDWQLADNTRDRYRTDFVVNEIPKLIDKYQPDQLIFLGDLTENKDNHPASLVNEIVEFFTKVTKQCAIIFLQGNHDFLYKENPFFKFLEKLDIVWIDRPSVLQKCLYLPHTRNHKQDWKGVDFNGHDFVMAHNIFEGTKVNGQKLSGIPTSIFPDNACVIAGDVHEPQTVDVVTYVGSPFLTDFGDDFQPRVLLLDDLKMKSIKVNGPQKRVVEVDWHGDDSSFRHSPDLKAKDIVKIKVNIERKDTAEWDKIRTHILFWGTSRDLFVYTIVPIVSYDVGERGKPVEAHRKTDNQYFKQFVQRNGIDVATAKAGEDILDEDTK